MSLCFVQAFAALGKRGGGIRESECLRHCLAHLTGVRHSEDKEDGDGAHRSGLQRLAKLEPWMVALRDLALDGQYCVLKDVSIYETLFTECRQGNFDNFQLALDFITANPTWPSPIQPAACLAAQKKKHDILRLCLDRGAKFDALLDRAVQLGAGSAPMLELLVERNWRGIMDSEVAVQRAMGLFKENGFAFQWMRTHVPGGDIDISDWVDLGTDADLCYEVIVDEEDEFEESDATSGSEQQSEPEHEQERDKAQSEQSPAEKPMSTVISPSPPPARIKQSKGRKGKPRTGGHTGDSKRGVQATPSKELLRSIDHLW